MIFIEKAEIEIKKLKVDIKITNFKEKEQNTSKLKKKKCK